MYHLNDGCCPINPFCILRILIFSIGFMSCPLWSEKFALFNTGTHLWKFPKCHGFTGVQSPGKWTKYQPLPELIWWLPELIFQFFPYWFSFPMTYINVCWCQLRLTCPNSEAVFVTCVALLHSALFITLIPHFNSHFVMYSASTMTADKLKWEELMLSSTLSVYDQQ